MTWGRRRTGCKLLPTACVAYHLGMFFDLAFDKTLMARLKPVDLFAHWKIVAKEPSPMRVLLGVVEQTKGNMLDGQELYLDLGRLSLKQII